MTQQEKAVRAGIPKDVQALLFARNRADRAAINTLRWTAEQLGGARDDAQVPLEPEARKSYIALQKAAFSLLYEVTCTDELLWYESNDPAQRGASETVDLCRCLRRFVNRTDLLTGDYLTVGNTDIARFLYAKAAPERVTFLLLHQLLALWSEDPSLNTLECFAGSDGDSGIRITLTLLRDPDAETPLLPLSEQTPLRSPELPDAAEVLAERFCSLYQAQIVHQRREGCVSCTVRLPAAAADDRMLQVQSDSAPLPGEGVSPFHAVLSLLLPTETILLGGAASD